jgi:hypothetical protein
VLDLGHFVLIIIFIPYGWYLYTKLNNIPYTFVEWRLEVTDGTSEP